MLTEEGCRSRRERLWKALPKECRWVLVADPGHVNYFTGFYINPVSMSQGERCFLLLEKDGNTTLIFDNFTSFTTTADYFADDTVIPTWYSNKFSVENRDHILLNTVTEEIIKRAKGPGLIEAEWVPVWAIDDVKERLQPVFSGWNVYNGSLGTVIRELRRRKEEDEILLLWKIMEAAKAGHDKALEVVQPGISEYEIYLEVQRAALEKLGQPGIVYGDFRVVNGENPDLGGPPTDYRLQSGDMFILDYSVVLQGYRSDNANTISAGIPSPGQQELFDVCLKAMRAGEAFLHSGAKAKNIFTAMAGPLIEADIPDVYICHGGHGLGLGHPEPPVIVSDSSDTLIEGDVITLEPGAYVKGVGGVRIEHNYLITKDGFKTLSRHELRLH